jgi:hypothetical protein
MKSKVCGPNTPMGGTRWRAVRGSDVRALPAPSRRSDADGDEAPMTRGKMPMTKGKMPMTRGKMPMAKAKGRAPAVKGRKKSPGRPGPKAGLKLYRSGG